MSPLTTIMSIFTALCLSINTFSQFYPDGTNTGDVDPLVIQRKIKSEHKYFPQIIHQIPSPVGLVLDITFDGNSLWVGGFMDDSIYKISPIDGSILKKIPSHFNDTPRGMEFDGKNLYVIDSEHDSIYKMDTINGNILYRFHAPSSDTNNAPAGLAWDGFYLWQTENFGNISFNIYKMDTLGNVLSSHAQNSGASGLTFTQNTLWRSDNVHDVVFEIDTSNFTVIQSFDAPGGEFPNGLAFDGQYLWLANGDSDSLYQIDIGFPSSFNEALNSIRHFKIYPNPSNSTITIETSDIGSLSILNQVGIQLLQKEITQTTTPIDVSYLSSGVYLIKLTKYRTVEVGKLIIR